ncbi:LysR family transcriptional regulator, partial [Kibdelosporangium lantanae]
MLNDPANGRHALNLVKEMTRLARVARTKPGNARTELVSIGEKLGASVPHFLPSFYEEAGRIFLEQDNTSFAGAMFTKAREAEKVHALTVDPVQLRNVFVEFSLAGAVSTKLMSEHSRWLAALSADVGAPLVVKDGRGIRLTRAGHLLAETATASMGALEAGTRRVVEEVDPDTGRVVLGFLHMLGRTLVPELVRAFRTGHPHVRYGLVQASRGEILARLRSGEVD